MPDKKGRFTKEDGKTHQLTPATPGNQLAKKLKTPELKEEAYKQYCEYLASGRSKEGWYFEHPELTLTWETMEKYIREEPQVFESYKKRVAEAKSFKEWETKGTDMLHGKMKAETGLYQMFMRNKFGWDKEQKTSAVHESETRTLLEKFERLNDIIE